jgi:glycosyltransferase involved in cell wall biosynthesis
MWLEAHTMFGGGRMIPEAGEGAQLAVVRSFRAGHVASYLLDPMELRRIWRRVDPDVVHVEPETYSFLATECLMIRRRLRAKVVVFGWENIDRRLPLVQRLCRAVVLRRAEGVICGNAAAEALVRQYGFKGPVRCIPQVGVDGLRFHPTERAGGGVRIGFAGRLVHEKGVDVLLKAYAAVRASGADVELLIAGSGPCEASLRSLARTLGVAEGVRWVGPVGRQEMPEFLNNLSILVLPSRTMDFWAEQFGLVLAEAMACGVCCVGSRSGAIPEVIGDDSLTFPENDDRALGVLLGRLVSDPVLLASGQTRGLARAQRFTFETIATQIKAFYEDVAGDEGYENSQR